MKPLILIAGPCVIEDEFKTMVIAEALKDIVNRYPEVDLIFKASFDKANRTSSVSYRGIGLYPGLNILSKVRAELGLKVTTDVHETIQVDAVASVCDVIQIPAFLSRQTDLLVAAAKTKKTINIKKGQFMAPTEMKHVADKVRIHTKNVWLCERGTFFGYGRLVNDFAGVREMMGFGFPVIFDATHSVQQPASLGNTTGGNREMVGPLAKAAIAVGVDGLFFETHPKPDSSPSDGANMIPLDRFEDLLKRLLDIRAIL